MPPKGLTLVPLEENHLAEILAIERASNGAPWSEASFRAELDNRNGVFLVALQAGQVVGFGGVWLVIDEAHITTVAVHPEHRRKGIARKVVEELLRRAAKERMACATLEVRAGNEAAISLYESLGFKAIARRPRYYPDNREDAVVMWLDRLAEAVA